MRVKRAVVGDNVEHCVAGSFGEANLSCLGFHRKDQYLLSPVNCWYLVLHQTRRESRDHATLNDIFMNNVIVRLSQISEDVIRLFKKSKEIGLQMHEELLKVTNELYTTFLHSLSRRLLIISVSRGWDVATPCDKCQWGYGHGVNGEEMALDLELNDNGLSRVESKAEKQGVRGVAPVQPVMKTYHMYHAESISAESKLKEAEKQEEKQFNKSGDLSMNLLRHEDRPQRRSSVKKIEKMKEKASEGPGGGIMLPASAVLEVSVMVEAGLAIPLLTLVRPQRQAKYSENKLKCTKARNDYLLNLAATNAAISKYYIHDVSDLIDCCDLGFHASLARTFRTYLSAEYNLETSRHEGLDVIENAVDNLDSRSDKHTVMDMCNQVFCPPLKFEFQPHMGDEVCQVSAQQPVQTELLMRYHQLQSRLATLKIENEEVRKTLDATMQTLQDMLTVEDFDVSDAFQHSRSTESVKSAASETYMSKINIAKRRANQQETEMFYFTHPSDTLRNVFHLSVLLLKFPLDGFSSWFQTVTILIRLLITYAVSSDPVSADSKFKEYVNGSNLITKLQAKHDLLKQTLGEGESCGRGRQWGLSSLLGFVVAP
ncbi:hypothetical protein J1605_005440 [Eschrichtius robustus]|uniref:SLIT-ROBO Rho GTPase-activating protein 3 n=1 Tax=Eschrichtius robustus TaxID=9764 RepID=A0AB34H5T1_ESCRO|nr:hypothetical protein J1605_005440 [Eschrichtius robustus]